MSDRLQVGDILTGEVSDLGMKGEGIVKYGAYPVFTDYCLVGEKVRVRVKHVTKNYAFADLIEVLTPSDDRIKPKCPYFGKCGGCDLQHMSYDAQLALKQNNIARDFRKTAGINAQVGALVPSQEWEYRNKLSMPFGRNRCSGRIYLGYYGKLSHDCVPVKWCPLHGEWAAELVETVVAWAQDNEISVYDELSGIGILRHLVARMLDTLSVCVVVNSDGCPFAEDLYARLRARFDGVTLYVSPNLAQTNVIMGDKARLLYGEEREQNLGAFKAKVSPVSFLQVNGGVRDKLYAAVCEELRGFDGDIVELYSGVGLLTAQLAAMLPDAEITSAEIVPDAVKDAEKLMSELGFSDRVDAVCADAAWFCRSLSASKKPRALILDPPRKGCAQSVLEAAVAAEFERIIYVSCNPATLARDVAVLTSDNAYSISRIQPFDMFPQTAHVETFVVLDRML